MNLKEKIRERLLDFRVYLKENFATNTIITNMNRVDTFYHHFGIAVPKLPLMSYEKSPNDATEYRDFQILMILKKQLKILKIPNVKLFFYS